MEVAAASGIRRITPSTMAGEPDVQKGALPSWDLSLSIICRLARSKVYFPAKRHSL